MVWGLFPDESLRGAHRYYIFREGTYKVGRKDCDVVVQTDTAVSRLHSEIFVDKMVSRDPSDGISASSPSHVRIIDRSKYGTFINKELGSKALRNQEAMIKDGDSVTFGTGNATFRVCFVPLVIFIHSRKPTRKSTPIQDMVTSIGGYTTRNWSPECTHVIVDESSPVTQDLVEAVAGKKPIVLSEWLKVLTEKNIRAEFPSCTSFLPTLSLEGTMVKIVEPKIREKCLEGYTFVLGSSHKYKFGDKFQSLLEVASAKLLHVDEFCSSSQISADGEDDNFILVIPGESADEFNHIRELSSLSRVTDTKIVAAILSGCFDSSIIEPPSIVVSSSHSTDETIVADSDVELATATSNHAVATDKSPDTTKYECKDKDENEPEHRKDARYYDERENNGDYANTPLDKTRTPVFRDGDGVTVKRLDKGDEAAIDRDENSDIIFTQDLIVRDVSILAPVRSSPKKIINFKCFRKGETQSGNSFRNLIPFSKDPYKESDGGSNESSEYMREEKKRKQLEAIAEDLFNNDKGRKRASSGTSLQALLTRR